MADKNYKVTLDTGEWIYPDKNGTPHTVTDGQTFNFTVEDDGASTVKHTLEAGQSVTTTDGYTLEIMKPMQGIANALYIGFLTDTAQNTVKYNVGGELWVRCPVTGIVQIWKPAKFDEDDADTTTTYEATFEDQFGNSFVWNSNGVTVGAQ